MSLSLTHTLVNVEFLHETEDLLGEHFGLDLIQAVSGHREVRELPGETAGMTRRSGKVTLILIWRLNTHV